MENLVTSDQPREFYVYVDPKSIMIQHQVGLIGSFASIPVEPGAETLMFLPNPKYKTFISPFQNNLLKNYTAEFNLEVSRQEYYAQYPCRLQAVFLLDSASDAQAYAKRHPDHVGKRVLKRCKTAGPYRYSKHDSAWVNFMREDHSMDMETLRSIGRAYWSGDLITDHPLQSMGNPWTDVPVHEILFMGRIDFDDKTL